MNLGRRAAEPELVCTCNDLYREDIRESIALGCEDAADIMFDQSTQFRCALCRPIIERMLARR